jgi:hypothetical protein
MEAVRGAGQRRDALAAAQDALTDLRSVLWQVSGSELGPMLKEIDDLVRLGEAARVAVIEEALDRGEASSDRGPDADAAAGLAGSRGFASGRRPCAPAARVG